MPLTIDQIDQFLLVPSDSPMIMETESGLHGQSLVLESFHFTTAVVIHEKNQHQSPEPLPNLS